MLYSVLIYGVDGVFEALPQDAQDAHMAKHGALQKRLKHEGSFKGAVRLASPATAVNVREAGDQLVVLDGPYAETKEQLLGFYLVEAESIEAAIRAARELPQGIAHMEVRPVMWASETLG